MARVSTKLFPELLERHDVEKFLNFPDEKLILAIREHSTPLLARTAQFLIAGNSVAAAIGILSYFLSRDLGFSLGLFFIAGFFTGGLVVRELVHWYFHLYIITNRKVIEVAYSPLLSELSNSVLLDQLRCTEIDAEMHGFISEIFDIGNVTMTFDRPTHQESFILRNVRSPRKIANLLSSYMQATRVQVLPRQEDLWVKNTLDETNKRPYRYMGEIQQYGGLN